MEYEIRGAGCLPSCESLPSSGLEVVVPEPNTLSLAVLNFHHPGLDSCKKELLFQVYVWTYHFFKGKWENNEQTVCGCCHHV